MIATESGASFSTMIYSETSHRRFGFNQVQAFFHSNKVVVMNIKNMAGIAVLVVTVAFAIQLIQQNNAQANPPVQDAQTQELQSIEFARLVVSEDGENVTWLIGGNVRNRTEPVRAAYRRLGGTGQGTFADLLDQIGSGGWNLVELNGSTWIFSRPS